MKAIKIIIVVIFMIILSFVVGTLAKHSYDTRYDRATQKANEATAEKVERMTEDAFYNEIAVLDGEAFYHCNHVIEKEGEGSYSGSVYVYQASEDSTTISNSVRYNRFLTGESVDIVPQLQDLDAILCIKSLDTTKKICKFDVPTQSVEFISAIAEFTLLSYPTGELIIREIVDSYDPKCPNRWSGLCENGRCIGYDRIGVDTWLKEHEIANPTPTHLPAQAGGVCWTYELKKFNGTRSQAWESHLSAETKKLLKYRQFLEEVVAHNPQLEADGYEFYSEKAYLLPEPCH